MYFMYFYNFTVRAGIDILIAYFTAQTSITRGKIVMPLKQS